MLPAFRCSTPFGITDFITQTKGWGIALLVDWCSTPFGITDFITPLETRRNEAPFVLNAFRHH